jgi:hypothetical protein
MSFFEPLPPEPPRVEHTWRPPLWDRPSEGTLPAVVPVHQTVVRTDELVVEIELVRVYPNGFTVGLMALGDPRSDERITTKLMGFGHGRGGEAGFPRLGVRFADGRTAGRESHGRSVTRDDRGMPTEPLVRMTSGGGGSSGMRTEFWIHPLPPPGPVEVIVGLPTLDDLEQSVIVDGDMIIDASRRAQVIWE